MRCIYIVLITFLVFTVSACQCLADDYSIPIEKYTLNNGCTVITGEDYSTSLVTIQLWVRAGSAYEGEFQGSGITHFVEHMVFKGEKSSSSLHIVQQLQELGGELDAATSKEYTFFTITIPKENLEKAMEIVCGIIVGAEFLPDELEKERQVILREMDLVDDHPNKYIINNFFRLAYGRHPFGDPVIGRKDLFQSITRDDIMKYYKSQYVPNNFTLVVVGNYEKAKLKTLIEETWGNIPGTFTEYKQIPDLSSVIGPLEKVAYKEVLGFYLVTGYYGPAIKSEDMYAMDVLAEIAGGGRESRLMKRLCDNEKLVADISAWSFTPGCTGIWGVSANLISDDWQKTMDSILEEIDKFKTDLVSDGELEKAKLRIKRSIVSGLETTSGRASDLAGNELYTQNPLFNDTYLKGIEKVTKEDIKIAAEKYLIDQNQVTFVLLPKDDDISKDNKAAETEREIVIKELDNGVRVLIGRDTRVPLINVRLQALGGLLDEKIPGLSYFASQIWLKENDDLVAKIESKGGGISTYSGYNSIGCSIQVFKDDLPLALDVLNKFIMGFKKTELTKMELVRALILTSIKQEEDSPYGYSFKAAKKEFFGKGPYRNSIHGTADSVNSIAAKDVVNFYKNHFVTGNLVISIFGDLDIDSIEETAKKVFSSLKKSKYIIAKEYPLPAKSVKKEVLSKQIKESVAIIAYPGISFYSKDRYAIELLNQIFSGQAGRLYQNIREEKALAYSLGSVNLVGRVPGSFMVYVSASPEKVNEATTVLFEEIGRIKKDGLSDSELERIKNYVKTQIQKNWESVSGIAQETVLSELYGLGWDYFKSYLGNIDNVTKEDIQDVANKYLRDDWYTMVIVGPEVGEKDNKEK